MLSCLVAVLVCTAAWAETPGVQQSDRRDRRFPQLVVESGGRRGTCDALAFTRDGKHLLAVGDDKVVRVWEYLDGRIDPQPLEPLRWSVWGPKRGAIYALAISPDPEGRRVAIGGVGVKTTAAAVIDRQTGEIQTIYADDYFDAPKKGGFQAVRAIAFSPGAGERIAFGSEDGSVWLWRPNGEGKEKLRWVGRHSRVKEELNRIRLLHFLNDGTLLSVAENGEVCRWDLAVDTHEPDRLKLLDGVFPPIHDVLLSPDGKWLVARATKKPFIYVRSFDGKQRKDIVLENGAVASSLAFNARGQLAAGIRTLQQNADRFHMESDDQIRVYDLSGEAASAIKILPHSGRVDILAFYPDREGQHLAVAGGDDHQLTLWDLSCPKERPTELRGVGSGIWNVSLSRNGRYLAFQTQRNPAAKHPNQRGRDPWSYFDLTKIRWGSVPAGFALPDKEETQDGWQVKAQIPGTPTDPKVWYVVHPGKGIAHKLPWNKDLQMMPRCYAFLPRADGQPVRLAVGHYYGVSVFEVTEERVRQIWLGIGHEGTVMSLAVSEEGDWMVSASDDQTIAAWSLRRWPCGSELGATFERDEQGQIVVKQVDLFSPAWEAGLVEQDRIVELTIGFDLTFRRPSGNGPEPPVGSVDDCLKALADPDPGKSLSFRIKRGRQEWNTNTAVRRRPLWRFFPTRDKEWVLWMPMRGTPYYYASNKGDKYVGWQMNNSDDLKKKPKFYPAEQFRELFYRRGVIDKLLAKRDIRQALDKGGAPLEPPNFNKLFDAVSVSIESPQKRVQDTDVDLILDIKPRTPDPDYAPERAALWVNDHRLKVWPEEGEAFPKTWPMTWTIKREQLRAGENDVVLQCYNRVQRRGEGRLEASLRVHCQREVRKQNLYGLVVSVNDYSRAARRASGKPRLENLHTPLFDMQEIREAWLSQRGGKVYSTVEITHLNEKNSQADPQTILQALRGLDKKVAPDDQVFVFFAMHGDVLDSGGEKTFVICCPDYDRRKPETSISARKLYEALASIRCRKVVFLDVCHSGEAARPVRDLTPGGRGPIIFAACDLGESSLEPPPVKGAKAPNHSFFVSALLEAFQRADRDDDGLLDAREIYAYTLNRVPELLKEGKFFIDTQTPTSFLPDTGPNILLARSAPPRK
jgi:WD40 repeat protein